LKLGILIPFDEIQDFQWEAPAKHVKQREIGIPENQQKALPASISCRSSLSSRTDVERPQVAGRSVSYRNSPIGGSQKVINKRLTLAVGGEHG